MTTYATGNPLGSKDPRDLYDNAENFDAAMNDRTNVAWRDRFGVSRKTWFGIEDQVNTFLARSGFELPPLQYVDGSPLTVDRSTQTIERGGNLYSVKLPSSFPVVLSGNWSEDEGLLVVRGDQSLRQEITSTSPSEGSSIIGNATVSVSSVADIKIRLKDRILSSLCLHIIRLERLVAGNLFGAHLLLNLSMTEEPSLARLSHGMVRRPRFQTTWMAMEKQTLLGLDAG